MMNENRAKTVVENIPDTVLLNAAKERREHLREKLGPYATLKKMRVCKGCNKEMTTRALYSHSCTVPKNQR
jgi:hypothetical protein